MKSSSMDWSNKCLLALGASWGCAVGLPLAADTVHLKNGGLIKDCRVLKDDPKAKAAPELLHLRTPGGRMGVPRDLVLRVEPAKSVFDVYDERRAAVVDRDVNGLFSLARWCAETVGLREERKALLERVIALKKDHAEARRLLGYAKVDGAWVLPPPLSVVLSVSGDKDVEKAVRDQVRLVLADRGDIKLESAANPDDGLKCCELAASVACTTTQTARFYGLKIRGPATQASATLKAKGSWLPGDGRQVGLRGEVPASIPNAKTQALIDGFTQGARELHAFFDELIQLRVARWETTMGRAAPSA
jgi:hypothetical protein